MKRTQWIGVLVVFLLAVAAAIPELLGRETRQEVSVAVVPREGITVLSENPVTVTRGASASFRVEIREGYYFDSASAGEYRDGVLTLTDVRADRNVYLSLLKDCTLEIEEYANGSVELLSGDKVIQGQTASLRITPAPHYTVGSIEVNGTAYPAISGDVFEFTVTDDSCVTVRFQGEPLDFLTVTNNLGYVVMENTGETYRYGDVLKLDCAYDTGTVIFDGWSVGGYLADGGTLISGEPAFSYTLTENSVLYANFSDRSTYTLTYDGNGGKLLKNIEETHGPGQYVNLALAGDNFQRKGYTLIGFSTTPEGEDLLGTGAMIVMPRGDLTLYAQWAKHTDAKYLDYENKGGNLVIRGLSEAGRKVGLTTLVIPQEIDGKRVTEIGRDGFSGCETLETLVLPVGLKKVNDDAFSDCASLTAAWFPETIVSIEDGAFARCDSLADMRVIATLPRALDYDYDSALVDKYMRLKHTEGKRIILVGGSNLAFGINSELIQAQYPDYTVVNMGVSVHYGILPLFDMLQANVHEGDIVIFCPEYTLHTYAGSETTNPLNWQYLESNYDILKDIDLRDNRVLLEHFDNYLYIKREYLPDKKIRSNSVYTRARFNQYGDMTAAREPKNLGGFPVPDTDIITELGMQRYNALCKELTERGVMCCFSFPVQPSGGASAQEKDAKLADFRAKLEAGLDERYITIISNMSDYFFAGRIFYDDPYHLTLKGADIRTEQLIEDLNAYLEGLT